MSGKPSYAQIEPQSLPLQEFLIPMAPNEYLNIQQFNFQCNVSQMIMNPNLRNPELHNLL